MKTRFLVLLAGLVLCAPAALADSVLPPADTPMPLTPMLETAGSCGLYVQRTGTQTVAFRFQDGVLTRMALMNRAYVTIVANPSIHAPTATMRDTGEFELTMSPQEADSAEACLQGQV